MMNAFDESFQTKEKSIIRKDCLENMHLSKYIEVFGHPWFLGDHSIESYARNANIAITADVIDSTLRNVRIHNSTKTN